MANCAHYVYVAFYLFLAVFAPAELVVLLVGHVVVVYVFSGPIILIEAEEYIFNF